jgi:hypothetical protein
MVRWSRGPPPAASRPHRAASSSIGPLRAPSGVIGAGSISRGHGFAPSPTLAAAADPIRAASGRLGPPRAPSAPDPSPRDMVSRPARRRRGLRTPSGPLRAASGPFGAGSISRGNGFAPGPVSALPKGACQQPSSTPGAATMPRSNGVVGNSPVTAGEARSGLMCACPRDRPPHGDQPRQGDRPPNAAPRPPFASSATCAAPSGWRSAGHEKTPG